MTYRTLGWRAGDAIAAVFTMPPRLRRINDARRGYGDASTASIRYISRQRHAGVAAIMAGPLVLGGLTDGRAQKIL
eukprot:gene1442-9912_t